MKRAIGVTLAVLAALLLLGVALTAILVKPERIKEDILARVREKSGYTILAGPASFALRWPGVGIRIRDLKATAPDSSLDLAVDEAFAFVKLVPLLQRRVELERIVLERPSYVMRPAGSDSARVENAGNRAAALAFLVVESWAIQDGRFHQSGSGGEVELSGMELQGSFRWDDREGGLGSARGDIGGGAFRSAGRAWPVPPLHTRAEFRVAADADSVSISRFEVASGAVRGEFIGGYSRRGPGWGGELEGRIDPVSWADLKPLLPDSVVAMLKRMTLDGSLAMTEFHLRQEPGRPSAMQGKIRLEDVTARVENAPAGLSGFHGTLVFTQETVDLEDGRGEIAGAPLTVDLHIAGKEPRTGTAHVVTSVPGTTVGRLLPAGSALTLTGGRFDLDITAQSVLPGKRIPDLQGRLDCSGLGGSFRSLALRNGGGTIRFAGRTAAFKDLHASLGRSDFQLEGRVPDIAQPWATFHLTSTTLDLDELAPPADSTKPARKPAQVIGLPGEGTVEIGTLYLRGQRLDDVRADARVDRDGVQLRNLSGKLHGGDVSGGIGFAPRAGSEAWGYEGTLKAKGVGVGPLLSSWIPGAGILEGTMEGNVDLSGEAGGGVDPRRALNLLGDVRLEDGAFRDLPGLASLSQFVQVPELMSKRWPFQSLATHFKVRDGSLVLEGLKLVQAGLDWQLSGRIGIDGTLALSGTLRALPERLKFPAQVAFLAPYLAEPDGRIPVDFRLEGPALAPRVTLDWDAAAQRASERLKAQESEKLKQGIEEQAKDPETLQKLKQLLGGKKGGE